MDKRLEKRQKRKVARARARVRVSEPDLRTPEQVMAAREASRSVAIVSHDPHSHYAQAAKGPAGSSEGVPAKGEELGS
jgi:hypothetical protein